MFGGNGLSRGIRRSDECRLLDGKLEWYGLGLKLGIRDVCIAVGSIIEMPGNVESLGLEGWRRLISTRV